MSNFGEAKVKGGLPMLRVEPVVCGTRCAINIKTAFKKTGARKMADLKMADRKTTVV